MIYRENLNKEKTNINKKEFALKLLQKEEVAKNLSKTQVELGVDGILEFLQQSFVTDCTIELRGFGKFICKGGKVRFKSFVKF